MDNEMDIHRNTDCLIQVYQQSYSCRFDRIQLGLSRIWLDGHLTKTDSSCLLFRFYQVLIFSSSLFRRLTTAWGT